MLEYIILLGIGGYVISEILHRKERKELLNRIMSRTFEEYKYFDKKYRKDLKEVDTLRKDARKGQDGVVAEPSEAEEKEQAAYEKFNTGLEEEWTEEELDKKKIVQMMEKEE